MEPQLGLRTIARSAALAIDGRQPSYETVRGWIINGKMTPDGPVKLQANRVGGRWAVTPAALDRFLREVTAGVLGQAVAAG